LAALGQVVFKSANIIFKKSNYCAEVQPDEPPEKCTENLQNNLTQRRKDAEIRLAKSC
jgi:hypothetical protein